MFLPLLLGYLAVILLFAKDQPVYDESRYLLFADHLLHGYYSPTDNINLWNGPGYPLILTPFVLFQIPLVYARLLNAFFLFGSVLFFRKTLRLYMEDGPSFCFAYLLGLFPPLYGLVHMLYTETFSYFLISGFIYFYCRLHQKPGKAFVLPAGFFLAYLALTKVFFGYVLMTGLGISLILWLWKRKGPWEKTTAVYSLAFLFCLPYLTYTYFLTGRVLYWSNSGGLSLYCLSTPYKDELGDWFDETKFEKNPVLAQNHRSFFNQISKLPAVEKDEAFKRKGIENIIRHPGKFVLNWLANVGRMLFNYPYSYTPQKLSTYAYMFPNMFLLVAVFFSLFPAIKAYRTIPFELLALLGFALIAFGGSSLLSAYTRQFTPLVLILGLWIFFLGNRTVRIRLLQGK
jgi:hypothetical protein